ADLEPPAHSAADVWSCTIFHPSENLRKTSVKIPCGVLPSESVKCHAPRTKAASGPSGSIRSSANSSFPISLPSPWYRVLYRASAPCQPEVSCTSEKNVSCGEFQ